MRPRIGGCLALVLLVGSLLTAAPVCAQPLQPQQVSKPYRSLFGGDDSRIPSLHALDLNFSFDSGIDDGMYSRTSVPGDAEGASSQGFQEIYIATTELVYELHGGKVNSELRGLASIPYYSLFPDDPLRLAYGGSGIVGLTSGRTTINASGNFLHSPYYSAALDPSSGPGVGSGYLGRLSALNPTNEGTAGAALAYQLGRRTSTTLGYSVPTRSTSLSRNGGASRMASTPRSRAGSRRA